MDKVPKESNRPPESESVIQSAAIKSFSKNYPDQRGLLFSVHNNAGNAVSGSVAVAMGRVKGASDTIYLSPFGVLLIEFKSPTGKQSKEQVEWSRKVWCNGYDYLIVSSVDQFEFYVNLWNELKGKINVMDMELRWIGKNLEQHAWK